MIKENYDFSKVKIHLATPCYGGTVTADYMRSMCNLISLFKDMGIRHEVKNISNDSLVTRARACLLSTFLADPDATHMMFIDADITFHPKSVLRLLSFDEDVVGGPYPMKSVNWASIKSAILENPDISEEELVNSAAQYVINVHSGEVDMGQTGSVVDGFVKVANIGTGFLLMKKQVFDVMRSKLPEEKYKNDIPAFRNRPEAEQMWTFFDTWCHPKTKRYLSEDYAFCQKWIELGGTVWADLMCPLHHRGSYSFRGKAIDYFKKFVKK